MRPTEGNRPARTWRKLSGLVVALVVGLSVLGGTVQAADSRKFSVIVGPPTPVSQGGVTKFDVTVDSDDNQTIANIVLSLPGVDTTGAPNTWPPGVTISEVFGVPSGAVCSFTSTSATCDLGNFDALVSKTVSVLVNVPKTVSVDSLITFSASAETNNENGTNNQVVTGTSTALNVIAFNANSLTTANKTGFVATSGFEVKGSGNLQTKVNPGEDTIGRGNAIFIGEGTNKKQPAYCTDLGLVCQSDFVNLTINDGLAARTYIETVLVAKVPGSYKLSDAFVIHFVNDAVEVRFPIFFKDAATTACADHPERVPCADFSLSNNIVTITVHTKTNGRMNY